MKKTSMIFRIDEVNSEKSYTAAVNHFLYTIINLYFKDEIKSVLLYDVEYNINLYKVHDKLTERELGKIYTDFSKPNYVEFTFTLKED